MEAFIDQVGCRQFFCLCISVTHQKTWTLQPENNQNFWDLGDQTFISKGPQRVSCLQVRTSTNGKLFWRMLWVVRGRASHTGQYVCILTHTHTPGSVPGTFLGFMEGSSRAPCSQATGYRQRAGQAVTSLSFIHLLLQSFLLPTGSVLRGMCPQAQSIVPLSSPGFFQINTGHKERPCWRPLALTPLSSPQWQRPLPAPEVPLATE